MKTKKIKMKLTTLPKVIKNLSENKKIEVFPLKHYSYSTFVKFSTNPILFKIQYINRDVIDTVSRISGVIGKAFHRSMEEYYNGVVLAGEEEGMLGGMEAGMKYLEEYNDGFIEFTKEIPNKQKAQEIFSFAYNSYVSEAVHKSNTEVVSLEEQMEMPVDVEWKGERLALPVPLKGIVDKLIREDGKLKVIDYKTTRAFSDPEKIDGAKIIQCIQYYLLVYATYGEPPVSMVYEEVKTSKNRDGSPQVKRYEVVYSENEQFFDFYFRLYDDMTRAINGEAVFVPNIQTMFDNEIAIIAYINRLDMAEETAKLMKKLRVETITDLLKKQIQDAGSMRKFLQSAEKQFVSAKNLNYEKMNTEEKIQTKLMEHGMLIRFEDKIKGNAVDLYRYNPSIGLKMSRLVAYVADVEQVVGQSGIRVLAPIPNSSLIGFEIPRKLRTFPDQSLAVSENFELAIGVDIMGEVYRFDITKAPHMLIAGATGSGKSVFLNSIITQLNTLNNIELHLFDPKMVELSRFKRAENTVEYQSTAENIYLALDELVKEMNRRYDTLAEAGVRNIEEYSGDMKYKFIVIDEFGDLTISNEIMEEKINTGEVWTKGPKAGEEKIEIRKTNLSKEISKYILLLAQKARAAGIHMIIATQRPSVDIITGSIKANFPTKVAFRTAKVTDSQVLLDEPGAEKLLGKGDMIFSSDEGMIRLQGFNF